MESRHLSVSQAWNAARAAGVKVVLIDDRLELQAARKPPETVLNALRQVREELILLLRQEPGKLCGIDYIDHYEERAAFGEFEAGMTRNVAELNAYECCISLWMSQNPPEIPDRYFCVHCGAETGNHDLALALQTHGRNAWVHARCHRPFLTARRQFAIKALAQFGISPNIKSASDFGKKAS